MLPSVPTLPLSTLRFVYTSSKPFYLFPDLTFDLTFLCLKCTLHSVHPCIYLQFSFPYNGPTNSGKAGSNYIDIGTGGIGSDIDTGGTSSYIGTGGTGSDIGTGSTGSEIGTRGAGSENRNWR